MALSQITFANKRKHRNRVATMVGKSPQVERTNLSVTPTGSAVAIRPPKTAIRRMNDKGQGEVGYF